MAVGVEQQSGTVQDQVIGAFVAAWNTRDEAERRRLLERCWAEDGVFIHSSGEFAGRKAQESNIRSSVEQWPDGAHVEISPVEEHHRWLEYTWRILRPDGSLFAAGMHVAKRAADGRLQKVINFPIPRVGG